MLADSQRPDSMAFPLWHWSSVRLRIACMVCFIYFAQGLMKTDLSMAMVCMINHTAVDEQQRQFAVNRTTEICRYNGNSSNKVNQNGDLTWNSQEQAWIFASIYWSGLVSALSCSFLERKLGPSRVLLIGTSVNVIGTFLTPLASEQGAFYALAVIRLIMGFGQGVLLPCAAAVISNWFPVTEKSTAVAIYTMGNQLSTIVGIFVSAQLCQISFLGGWPSIFYIYGAFGGVFCFFWFFLVSDSPAGSRIVSEAELKHITNNRPKKLATSSKVTPWKAIFKSTAVWSAVSGSVAQGCVIVSLSTYLPLYYHTVLKLDLTSNGIMSALPFAAQLLVKIIVAPIADRLKKRNLSVTLVTKVFNSIAAVTCAGCLLGVAFLNCTEQALAVVLLCIGIGSLSFNIPGCMTSLVSIAPPYTATVYSISSVIRQAASISAPYVVGAIAKNGLASEWRWVFVILAVILISSGTFFLICGSAVEQDWVREKVIAVDTTDIKTTKSKC